MKFRIVLFSITLVLLCTSLVYSSWMDTGYIEWNQPNGITFIARLYGDEFENWMETKDGFQITKNYKDGYYYYATIGKDGDYMPSSSKVSIDKPLESSMHLQRSESKKTQLKQQRIDFNNSLATNYILQLKSAGFSLAIVLIDFTPITRDQRTHKPGPGYNYQSFYDMFFSSNTYTDAIKHPDHESVFGSVNDYYWEQTGNRYHVGGAIINPTDPQYPDKPLWLQLNQPRDYYDSSTNFPTKDSLLAYLYDQAVSVYPALAGYAYIGFIYGGDRQPGNLWPNSKYVRNRRIHIVSEKYNGTFGHIGTHCHELGHSFFQLWDQYEGYAPADPTRFALMSTGVYNGPNGKGACPAPISAIYKYDRVFYGQLNTISLGTYGQTINYGFASQNVLYKVVIPNHPEEYFILECRRRDGFNQYTPSYTQSDDRGIFIWYGIPSDGADKVELKYADNSSTLQDNDFPYNSQYQDFTNSTTPSSNTRIHFVNYSNVAIKNIHIVNDTYGVVDVVDDDPLPPNISIGGSWGSNPIISWTNNGEDDISHYILKKEYDTGSGWGTPVYINPASSPYTDPNVIRLRSGGDVVARYSVQAVDNASNSSEYSSYVSTNGQTTWKNIAKNNPDNEVYEFSLGNNYPNPFNPTTIINYTLPQSDYVSLRVYDNLGREIQRLVDSHQEKGNYSIPFNAENLPSGIYYYTISTSKNTATKKMLLVK